MILNQDFQGTILLMVFDFQGVVKRWALIIYISLHLKGTVSRDAKAQFGSLAIDSMNNAVSPNEPT